jgi:hypothetical protein
MNKKLSLGMFFIVFFVAGCVVKAPAVRFQPFSAQTPDIESTAVVRIIIPQNEVVLASEQGKYTPTGGSIAGVLIDLAAVSIQEGVNSERRAVAADRAKPMTGLGLAEEFKQEAYKAIAAAISESSWLKVNQTSLIKDEKKMPLDYNDRGSVLQIRIVHNLSIDASVLVVQAHIRFFRKGQQAPAYYRYYTYFPDRIDPDLHEVAIAKWAENSGAKYRSEAKNGLDDLVKMINQDFLVPRSNEENQETTVSVFDAVANSNVIWTGKILYRDGARVIFQEQSLANFFSFIPVSEKIK